MFEIFKNHTKTKIYVDFENVKIRGLDGLEELTEDDILFLFHSRNADTLTIPTFEKIKSSKAEIKLIKCMTGSNAMDFVISTLVGSHIAKDTKETKYYIVSNDKGYQAVIDYWKDSAIKRIINLKQVHNETLVTEEKLIKTQKMKSIKQKKTTQSKTKNQSQPNKAQKKKHRINVRSRIGMLVRGLKKADMDKMEAVVKNGNENTYSKLLTEKFGNKGNDYYAKLKPLFNELKQQ